ncbi:MAG: NAD(P)H-hydrate epimerase [Candidatus Aenigmarchaeota archaeon]|nr:NAD(P)H-hydrate epimerase [Candidatus Aenigmarchaeota archaeon]
MDIPAVTVAQMERLERLASAHFGIEVVQLMEHAGRAVAELSRELAGVRGRTFTILVGKGHNGGDALVAGRLLASWGAQVNLILPFHPDDLAPLTKSHYGTATALHLNRMTGVDALQWPLALRQAGLIIDGLWGYHLRGQPQGLPADLIRLANASGRKILAIDCPSGLDCDSGQPADPCIRAAATITFTLPKQGLVRREAKPWVGTLWVADVGVPFQACELAGIPAPRLFEKKSMIKVS